MVGRQMPQKEMLEAICVRIKLWEDVFTFTKFDDSFFSREKGNKPLAC
jgi:hypothetical protein